MWQSLEHELKNNNEDKEARKSRKVAIDMKSTQEKAKDREVSNDSLTDYYNGLLLKEFHEIDKNFVHCVSMTLFYAKRIYSNHCTMSEEDLDLPHTVCKSLFEIINVSNVEVPMKKKAQEELSDCKKVLFSDSRKALYEYKVILCRIMIYVIPRFERPWIICVIPGQGRDGKILVCGFKKYQKVGSSLTSCIYHFEEMSQTMRRKRLLSHWARFLSWEK